MIRPYYGHMLVFHNTFHFRLMVANWLKAHKGRVDLCSVSERLSLYFLTAKQKSATMFAKCLKNYKLKQIIKTILRRKILKESQYLYKCPGKQYTYIH